MTYELAKQLKDAGFPFKQSVGFSLYYFNSKHESIAFSYLDSDAFPVDFETYVPTLSELIEACGDNWRALEMLPQENRINAVYRASGWDGQGEYGLNPEEAVAKLWLKLNAKE